MATSRISSNSPDWLDLAAVIRAFEQMNNCIITVTGRAEGTDSGLFLSFLVEAHNKNFEIGEVPTLAWVRCRAGLNGHKTMEAAIMWSLYQLDWKLEAIETELRNETA